MKARPRIKKALSLVLAIMMVCSTLTFGTLAAPLYDTTEATTVTVTVPNGTETPDSYTCTVVHNVSELTDAITAGNSVILANDIDMGGGKISTALQMADGTLLEGNGYKIYNFSLGSNAILTFAGTATVQNLTIGGEEGGEIKNSAGLFVVNASNVVTFNNVVTHVDLDGTRGLGAWGALKGDVYLNNCVSNGTVDTTYTSAQDHWTKNAAFSGFFGWAETEGKTTSLINCVNNVDINGIGYVGGFFGVFQKRNLVMRGCVNNGTINGSALGNSTSNESGQYVGGLIGSVCDMVAGQTIVIEGCKNYAAISGYSSVAGLVGAFANKSGAKSDIDFTNCANFGAITAKYENAAGIVGLVKSSSTATLDVIGCTNYGSISGNKSYGVGGLFGNIENANRALTVTNCVNTGNITNETGNAGGIAGDCGMSSGTATFTNCLNRGDITAKHPAGIVSSCGSVLVFDGVVNIGTLTRQKGNYLSNFTGSGKIKELKNSYAFGLLAGTGAASQQYLCAQGATTYANNKYLVQDGYTLAGDANEAALNETQAVAVASTADAVVLLNAKFSDLAFAVGKDRAIHVTTPALRGTQDTVAENNVQKVRFVATIDTDATALKTVGFKVAYSYVDGGQIVNKGLTDGKPTAVSCEWIYNCIRATENGKTYTYNASDLGGSYIYALSVAGVPTDKGEVTFTVIPFTVDTNNNEVLGQGYTVVYNNGEFVSATPIVTQ